MLLDTLPRIFHVSITPRQVYDHFYRTVQGVTRPYLENCIGSLDGTHIPVCMPIGMQAPYRNRKSFLSINVLAACTFDLKFCYSGWEGSANDQRVWRCPKLSPHSSAHGRMKTIRTEQEKIKTSECRTENLETFNRVLWQSHQTFDDLNKVWIHETPGDNYGAAIRDWIRLEHFAPKTSLVRTMGFADMQRRRLQLLRPL
jgi:hypothetical protein